MPVLIGKSLGRYHILEQLGEGGMATVYKAFDTRLERDVAVKVIRVDQFAPAVLDRILKRFEREAKALARLTHPNIVHVNDFGDQDGIPYLVMDYLSGGTLKNRLGNPMPWEQVFHLLSPIVDALGYAHSQGIIHRDLKPSNILLTEKGQPLLTDFGIAKILELEDGQTLTGTGMGVGTPEYMAPEQGLGKDVDARADIYALGVMLYEMITGRKPYTADTPMAVLFKHMTDPLPRPSIYIPKLPKKVEQILLKALAKKPENRYPSMAELGDALQNLPGLPIGKTASIPVSSKPIFIGNSQETRVQPPTEDSFTTDTFEQPVSTTQERSVTVKKIRKGFAPPPQYIWIILGGVVLLSLGLGWLVGGGATKAFPTKTAAPTLYTPDSITTPRSTTTPTLSPLPVIGAGSTWERPADGMMMLYIPAGEFEMGSEEGDSDEQPVHTIYVDAFWMDETEVTNEMYSQCVNDGSCNKPGGSYYGDVSYADHPVVSVDWNDSASYCEWVGGRLPTEAEWEKAARGGVEGEAYPWGDAFDCKKANADDETLIDDYVVPGGANCDGYNRTSPAGSFSPNGYGLYDMSGNVWEWVNDWYASGYYVNSPSSNPSGPSSGEYRVLRGGSWLNYNDSLRSADRGWINPTYSNNYLGFRCSRSP